MPTLAAQTVLRVSYRKGRCAAHVLIGLRPLHLCGTRLEGGHRRLSRTLRLAWVEPKRATASSAGTPSQERGRCSATGFQEPLPHRPGVPRMAEADDGTTPRLSFTQPYRRERPWCPPSRRVPHKWSGRRPNKYMGRVSGLSFSNAEDLSEQRGWAPRSPPRDAQV